MGQANGLLLGLPESEQKQSLLEIMVAEAIKTSEIEGEYLSRQDVFSSIQINLGMANNPPILDMRARGAADLMLAVRQTFDQPLDEAALQHWHRLLLPRAPHPVGIWRSQEEPMRVISGPMGRETIHFQAPPAARVPLEMQKFLEWFNLTAPGENQELIYPPIRAGIAHLYFETIHPFEDGNGRIGRAISEKALSQGIHRPVLLSLSSAIQNDRSRYYDEIKRAQRSQDITAWLEYFVGVCLKAQADAEQLIGFTLHKCRFRDRFAGRWNPRQTKVMEKMLTAGPHGFEGGMSARKYMNLTQTSKATATRDLSELEMMDALKQIGQGRSTRYQIPWLEELTSGD